MSRQAPSIAGAGLIALDVLLTPDNKGPQTFAGGTCGNVLAIMAYLGWKSSPFATLGTDPAADRIIADLARFGVSSTNLLREDSVFTPVIIEYLRHDKCGNPHHRFAMTCPECGSEFPRPRVAAPRKTELGGFRPNMFFMDRLSASILKLADSAAQTGAFVVYEPSVRRDEAHWDEALALADLVKYSDDRIDSAQLEDHFASRDRPTWEIQTRGKDGLRFRQWTPKKKTPKWTSSASVSAFNVVDTCGAGDWCSAGIIDALGKSPAGKSPGAETMRDAVKQGQALAAWSIAYEGARGGMYLATPELARKSATALLRGSAGASPVLRPAAKRPTRAAKGDVAGVCAIGACRSDSR